MVCHIYNQKKRSKINRVQVSENTETMVSQNQERLCRHSREFSFRVSQCTARKLLLGLALFAVCSPMLFHVVLARKATMAFGAFGIAFASVLLGVSRCMTRGCKVASAIVFVCKRAWIAVSFRWTTRSTIWGCGSRGKRFARGFGTTMLVGKRVVRRGTGCSGTVLW